MLDVILKGSVQNTRVSGGDHAEFADILTPEAVAFVVSLERTFRSERKRLLNRRSERQLRIDDGEMPDFIEDTRSVREDSTWKVGAIPDDLQDRRVEITGPVERKMMINALNSGANVFMADFEDANSPTWMNVLQGQRNLRDAIAKTIAFTGLEGKHYTLNDKTAVLVVRPRGWHLDEKHFVVDGEPMSASLFDFGLYFFHNAKDLLNDGCGPYFYLPKIESHLEAKLWNDVFVFAQERLGISPGKIKATVLIETVLAAFEMEEILYELKDHIVGLNAGRWDYMFSVIKKFIRKQDFLLPDRAQLTMTVPFMRGYTELLVKTCHRRGAHAIGGMAAFVPNRKDAKVNEIAFARVTEDKIRESNDGFDGTWVAHPDLVPVARRPFDRILGPMPHQKQRMRVEVQVTAKDLLNFAVEGGHITESGMRNNINVGLQYLAAWLGGSGAVGIFNLMEDAATAEISRSQLWQWIHHANATFDDGRRITTELYRTLLLDEVKKIEEILGSELVQSPRFALARELFNQLVMKEEFTEFLTAEAYKLLD